MFLALHLMARTAGASTMRGWAVSNMKEILLAMENHREAMENYPTDIRDKQGKPLLSWRVRLLPFLESDGLYKQFRLDEPWDSPHNRQFIKQIPRPYRHPSLGREDGRTRYLLPCGNDTVFPDRALWVPAESLSRFSLPKIMLVEVDDDQAVIWTKPGDLDYDSTNPTKGLAYPWSRSKDLIPSMLVGLTDGSVGIIPETANPDDLRCLFSATAGAPSHLPLSWTTTLTRYPLESLVFPGLLLALVLIVAGILPAIHFFRAKTVFPGEFLCLILAANQVVFLFCAKAVYTLNPHPAIGPHGCDSDFTWLWSVPRLAGCTVCLLAVIWYRSSLVWMVVFLINFALWLFAACTVGYPGYYAHPAEGFATAIPPFAAGALSVAVLILTLAGQSQQGSVQRISHWAGIVAGFAVFVWFAWSWAEGLVYWHPFHGPELIRE
jgi:hypothetical protein